MITVTLFRLARFHINIKLTDLHYKPLNASLWIELHKKFTDGFKESYDLLKHLIVKKGM